MREQVHARRRFTGVGLLQQEQDRAEENREKEKEKKMGSKQASDPAYKHLGRNAYPGVPHRRYPVDAKGSPRAWGSPTVGTVRKKQKLNNQQIGAICMQCARWTA